MQTSKGGIHVRVDLHQQHRTIISRRRWTVAETNALVSAYKARINDIKPRKKTIVYKQLAEELNKSGILVTPVNAEEVQNKVKSLIRAFKGIAEGKTPDNAKLEPYLNDLKEIIESPGGYYFRNIRRDNASTPTYMISYDEGNFPDEDEVDIIIPDFHDNIESDIDSNEIEFNGFKEEKEEQGNSNNHSSKQKKLGDIKWERKRKLLELTESRKDKRLLLKLDFLREKERNKMLRHKDKQKWQNEMLATFKQFLNLEKSEKNCSCSNSTTQVE